MLTREEDGGALTLCVNRGRLRMLALVAEVISAAAMLGIAGWLGVTGHPPMVAAILGGVALVTFIIAGSLIALVMSDVSYRFDPVERELVIGRRAYGLSREERLSLSNIRGIDVDAENDPQGGPAFRLVLRLDGGRKRPLTGVGSGKREEMEMLAGRVSVVVREGGGG
jgi:hypothetical protein